MDHQSSAPENFIGGLSETHSQCGSTASSRNRPKPNSNCRRKREFISDEKKDESYWEKRRKNNEAAKRSREKRRLNDMVLENRVMALNEENLRLKTEVLQLKLRFGLISAAAYMEKTQQLSDKIERLARSLPHFQGSDTPVGTTPDSSETEQLPLREPRLPKHSSHGSQSDLSDGSSLDGLDPPTCVVVRDGVGCGVKRHEGAIIFNAHREPELPPPPLSLQRSVILYSSSSHPAEGHDATGSDVPLRPYGLETLSEVAQQLARRLDLPSQKTSKQETQDPPKVLEQIGQQLLHLISPQSNDGRHAPTSDSDQTHAAFYQHSLYTKDTSSSDGDPRSSDKEASTDDDDLPSSSSSETGRGASQNADPAKNTALPHKLRLKHLTVSRDVCSSAPEALGHCFMGENLGHLERLVEEAT